MYHDVSYTLPFLLLDTVTWKIADGKNIMEVSLTTCITRNVNGTLTFLYPHDFIAKNIYLIIINIVIGILYIKLQWKKL